MTFRWSLHTRVMRSTRVRKPAVSTMRTYLLPAYIVLLGILACVGWLYMGQTDDAPGAGMIGLAALLSSLVVAYRVARYGWMRAGQNRR